MLRMAAFFLLGLALIGRAQAEPFSVRCTDPNNQPPTYFATFDLDAKRVVFETPIGNIFRGDIEQADDQRIDFSIKPSIYKIGLVFDRRASKMVFPGFLTPLEIRPELVHACQFVPVRTVLAIFDNITKSWPNYTNLGGPVQPTSFRCSGRAAYTYVTFDRLTKKVLMEIQQGSSFPGEIETIEGHRVTFSIHVGSTLRRGYVWDDEAKTLTWPLAGAASPDIYPCTEIKVRTLLDAYGRS